MSECQRLSFEQLMVCELKTGRAFSMKNMFREFWRLGCRDRASFFFNYLSKRFAQLGLKSMVKVTGLSMRYFDHIRNDFKHKITKAICKGLNSKIQFYKASTRGFYGFKSYRTRILLYCG
jgi:transposase